MEFDWGKKIDSLVFAISLLDSAQEGKQLEDDKDDVERKVEELIKALEKREIETRGESPECARMRFQRPKESLLRVLLNR